MIWMAVTADKYELPMEVAESAGELAKMLGVTRNTVCSRACLGSNGRYTGYKIIRFQEIEEEDMKRESMNFDLNMAKIIVRDGNRELWEIMQQLLAGGTDSEKKKIWDVLKWKEERMGNARRKLAVAKQSIN